MVSLGRQDALLLIDIQEDFLPGGALAVPSGDEVIGPANAYCSEFRRKGLPVFAVRDWHPPDHVSFASQGGPWPAHCVQGTPGARFAGRLQLPRETGVVSKDSRADDAYSAFEGTDLVERLSAKGVRRVFVGGLATEFCVLETVLDARKNGLEVFLLLDAIRGLGPEEATHRSLGDMVQNGAVPIRYEQLRFSPALSVPLLTDLYELTMAQSYLEYGMRGSACFEFYVRSLPPQRPFLLAAGLEQALEYLEDLRYCAADIDWLKSTGRFSEPLIEYLFSFRFTGDVDAMPEGTVFFENEPILRVVAPLPQAQLVESRLVNLLHYQTLVATKAARCRLAAPGRTLIDYGLRRAHGSEAALLCARASYLAGFDGSSNVLAEAAFGVPSHGTMAHSFIEAHETEAEAFERFALSNPDQVTLLLDTYDTLAGARKAAELALRWADMGVRVRAVRLDSGDISALSGEVRRILDGAGLRHIRIVASGGLDEYRLTDLVSGGAPIDAFGVGSRLDTSDDVPFLDCAYKLTEYDGRPVRKESPEKATWPGRKSVVRHHGPDGRMDHDVVSLEPAQPERDLLRPVLRGGRRLGPAPSLAEIRRRVRIGLDSLPPYLRSLSSGFPYPVEIAEPLRALSEATGRSLVAPREAEPAGSRGGI